MVNTNRLKGLMVSFGYTQVTLAEKIGISKNALNLKINNNGVFDTNEIEKICEVLDITTDKDKVDIFLFKPSHKCNTKINNKM